MTNRHIPCLCLQPLHPVHRALAAVEAKLVPLPSSDSHSGPKIFRLVSLPKSGNIRRELQSPRFSVSRLVRAPKYGSSCREPHLSRFSNCKLVSLPKSGSTSRELQPHRFSSCRLMRLPKSCPSLAQAAPPRRCTSLGLAFAGW